MLQLICEVMKSSEKNEIIELNEMGLIYYVIRLAKEINWITFEQFKNVIRFSTNFWNEKIYFNYWLLERIVILNNFSIQKSSTFVRAQK